MSEEESERLYERHDRERDAYSRRTLGIDAAHKIGVGQIVKTGHQHTDNGRNGHAEDDTGYWSRGQECIIVCSMSHSGCKITAFIPIYTDFVVTLQHGKIHTDAAQRNTRVPLRTADGQAISQQGHR